MLPVLRLRFALILSAGLGCALAPLLLSAGCGPAAVGVEACRKIESARCEAALSCNLTKDEVESCKLLYQDQCLHGIENTAHRPSEPEVAACVDAVKATGACAANQVATMNDCPAAAVVSDAAGAKTPCEIVLSSAHELVACAFADAPDDGGTTTTSSTSTGGTGGTTASGGGGTGGTTASGGGGTGGTGGTTASGGAGGTGGTGGTTASGGTGGTGGTK